MSRGEDVSAAEQDRTLLVWKGDETFERVKIALDHPAQGLEYIEGSEAFLSASSEAITIVDENLTPRCLRLSAAKKASAGKGALSLRKTLVLPRAQDDVLEVALVFANGSAHTLRISDFAAEDVKLVSERTVSLGGNAQLEKGEEIVDAFLNGSKAIHLQTSRGRILPDAIALGATASATVAAYGLKTSTTNCPTTSVSTPTGPLLVACQASSTGSRLVLFQPTYPSVLATRDLPTSLVNAKHTSLVRLSDAVLGLVSTQVGADGKGRATAWTIDISLPSQGVGIAQMLESAAKTRVYLDLGAPIAAAPAATPRKGGKKGAAPATDRDEALLIALDQCLKGREATAGQEKDAEDAWAKWVAEEKAQGQQKAAEQGRSKSKFASRVADIVLSRALGREPGARPLGSSDVEVEAAPATTGPRGAYARNIIVSLLELGWLSDRAFAPHGVILGGLLPLGDWTSIDIALRRLRSVESTTLVTLLKRVVESAESPVQSQAAVGAAAPPSLARFLRTYVQVPVSPPLHRVALHRAGFTAEETTRVLDVLVGWFEEDAQGGGTEGGLAKGWEEMMGVPSSVVASTEAAQGKSRSRGMKGVEINQVSASVSATCMWILTSIPQVIQHLTLLLDAHLPLLLSHSPAHDLLSRLHTATAPVLAAQSELALAKGAFDAFTKENESRLAATGRNGKSKSATAGSGVIREYGAGLWKLEEVRL